MPMTAVVGDGGGCSGVKGSSQLAGLTDAADTDCLDVKFSSAGRVLPADGT